MVERFFSTRSSASRNPGESARVSLLSGPMSSGKTSLLFQFALDSVVGNNGVVVFLCSRRRLEQNPPFFSQGVDPSSEIFRRIQMKYVDDYEGVQKFFAAFHLFDTFPVLVIIDDFADFFDERKCQERYKNPRGRDVAMVRVLSLCRNAIDHANKRSRCELVLSDTHKGEIPRLLYMYKKWIPCIYTVKGGSSGSFILQKLCPDTANAKREFLKYSIALQYLELELHGLVDGVEC